MPVGQYRKRPLEIEAIQWDGTRECMAEVLAWSGGAVVAWADEGSLRLMISTLEGDMVPKVGDWVIKGIAHEYYFCASDVFDKSYEPVL